MARHLADVVSILLLSVFAALAGGCDDEEDPFATKVAPILEGRCASGECHGVVAGTADEFALDPELWLTFDVDANGKLTDLAAAEASVKAKVNSTEDPRFSSFLRKTYPVALGGQYHFGEPVFTSPDTPEFEVLAEYVASVKDGGEDADEPPLDPLEAQFRDTVYPLLIQKGCATATCHGDLNFGVSVFAAPVDTSTFAVSNRDLRETYLNARINVTTWGEPLRSRLIAKMLPLAYGGIPHKGGNDTFFAADVERGDDPRESADVAAILSWLEAEKQAALGDLAGQTGRASAVVVVGGPVPVGGPFEADAFAPGSDLYRLDAPFDGSPVLLTGAAHDQPADIRDPAISHDGKTIVFTMRRSEEDARNIYTIGVDGSGLRQLTHDSARAANGRVVANMAPVFGPNGGYDGPTATTPRIYYASTRGDLSDDARFQNADLYAMNLDGEGVERLTYTVVPEARPWFLSNGEFFGAMSYTIKRSAEGGYKGVLFRFPVDHNGDVHIQPEAHPHFGMSEPQQVFWGLRERADGRAVLTLMDEGNRTRGGQLALLERQFGPEVPVGAEESATLPGFRHALTVLTPDAAREGESADGVWRDPTPMPDGSILVAHAAGPVDLAAPPADLAYVLKRITVEEDPATDRPALKTVETLLDGERSWSQPVAVVPRAPEDPPHERQWNEEESVGLLVHSGVDVIEAVLSQLTPTGPKAVKSDIAFVRPVVPLSALADLVGAPLEVTAVPAGETRDGHGHATNLSLSGRMPLFAAVEIPPAPDSSLAAWIPARVPVRVVTLDGDKMAYGALQHQWYAVLPGERFPVGLPVSSYPARCAGCHGAMDGNPQTVLQPPTDLVTQASVTLSRYDGADRRKPLELPTVVPEMFVFADFRADVQPILDAKCVTCHGPDDAQGGLTLTGAPTDHYTDAYESLLRPGDGSAGGFEYVDAAGYRGRGSFLVEKLRNQDYEAPRAVDQPCPPDGAEPLTAEELQTITRWIELGATFVGRLPE